MKYVKPYWKCNFPMTPHVHRLVGWSVCLSVCLNSLKGREIDNSLITTILYVFVIIVFPMTYKTLALG